MRRSCTRLGEIPRFAVIARSDGRLQPPAFLQHCSLSSDATRDVGGKRRTIFSHDESGSFLAEGEEEAKLFTRFKSSHTSKTPMDESLFSEEGPSLFSDEQSVGFGRRSKAKTVIPFSERSKPPTIIGGRATFEEPKSTCKTQARASKQVPTSNTSDYDEALIISNLNRLRENVFHVSGFFKESQLAAILSACIGRNVLYVAPTGAGKSLVYQLPALVKASDGTGQSSGVTVVVSPLKALISDQAKFLMSKPNVRVGVLHGDISKTKQNEVLASINETDFLFVTPEQLSNPSVLSRLHENLLKRFVFDEAHCIFEWGRGFRPKYHSVCGIVREQFSKVPWTLLTATAPPDVRNFLIDSFKTNSSDVDVYVEESTDRKNLSYRIIKKPGSFKESVSLAADLLREKSCAIVYCLTRDECLSVAKELGQLLSREVYAYHGGLSEVERNRVLLQWQMGLMPVVVATSAFGMGIHHPSVRIVIHYSMPLSLTGYIQQCGRAGRDGKPAECIMLFSRVATKIAYQLAEPLVGMKQDVDEMISFCTSTGCIRKMLHEKLSGQSSNVMEPCTINCNCRLTV